MSNVWALHAAAALLLVMAGAARVRRPDALATAARGWGLHWVGRRVARASGALEAGTGLWVLAFGGWLAAAALAAAYAAFTVVTAVGVVRGAESCGCFGSEDAAPSWLHVALDAGLAACATAVAVSPSPFGLPGAFSELGADRALPLLVAVLADAVLAYLLLARLPSISSTRMAATA